MLLHDFSPFVLDELLLVLFAEHRGEGREQVFELDLRVDVLVLMHPPPVSKELVVNGSSGPICLLHQLIEFPSIAHLGDLRPSLEFIRDDLAKSRALQLLGDVFHPEVLRVLS